MRVINRGGIGSLETFSAMSGLFVGSTVLEYWDGGVESGAIPTARRASKCIDTKRAHGAMGVLFGSAKRPN